MSAHEKALDSIFNDMDDLETKKMFGGDKQNMAGGVDVTISIAPKGQEPDADDYPEGHDAEMCKGGCAMHKGGTVPTPELESDIHSGYATGDPEYKKGEMGMAEGGTVPGETDDLMLPPFLRKKKKG